MKKSTKMFLKIMPVVVVALLMVGNVFGAISPADPTGGTASGNISTVASNIWATIVTVVQILAIAAIVIAGVRYMFASADAKADIKKQTIILIAGAVLVFAASPVATFISNAANDIL